MAFFAFLRCGEYTSPNSVFAMEEGLARQDVTVGDSTSGKMVKIHLKASKTDLFRVGVSLQVHSTSNDLCPVTALLAYLTVRDHLHKSPQSSFFILPDFTPLTRQQFTMYLDTILNILNSPTSTFRPHSFCIGAATSAAAAGVPDHLLKTLGRWSSNCYQRYIRTPSSLIAEAQGKMATL